MSAGPVELREGPHEELIREGAHLLGVEEVIRLEVHIVDLAALPGPVTSAVGLRSKVAGHHDAVALSTLAFLSYPHHEETVAGVGLLPVPDAPVEVSADGLGEEILERAHVDG